MKKNVASQAIGAEMINATTGAAFTGTVTVYVTGDNGTQTIGSVGSGVCTHEGNGYHSYAPATAETNYNHIAWTFIGTGAIPATVQVYTDFPQSADHTSAIADIPTVSEFNARTLVAADYFDPAADTVANVTLVATTTANTDMRGTDGANTTTPPTAIENADALLKRDFSSVTGEAARSMLNALRFLRNKWSISGTTLTVTKEDDTTAAWTATVTTNASAEPVVGNDPA